VAARIGAEATPAGALVVAIRSVAGSIPSFADATWITARIRQDPRDLA
jgi:hypothetical protein